MTRRLFWLVMGITIGVLVVRKISSAAQKLTPRGLSELLGGGLADLSSSIREFTSEVRVAMSEREAQLREGAGLDGTLGKSDGTLGKSDGTLGKIGSPSALAAGSPPTSEDRS